VSWTTDKSHVYPVPEHGLDLQRRVHFLQAHIDPGKPFPKRQDDLRQAGASHGRHVTNPERPQFAASGTPRRLQCVGPHVRAGISPHLETPCPPALMPHGGDHARRASGPSRPPMHGSDGLARAVRHARGPRRGRNGALRRQRQSGDIGEAPNRNQWPTSFRNRWPTYPGIRRNRTLSRRRRCFRVRSKRTFEGNSGNA
jgi:hypothetical protein